MARRNRYEQLWTEDMNPKNQKWLLDLIDDLDSAKLPIYFSPGGNEYIVEDIVPNWSSWEGNLVLVVSAENGDDMEEEYYAVPLYDFIDNFKFERYL